ncbi:hypothetical protein DWZ50_19830, partial [Mediterraneibacter gnavus]
SFEGIGNTDGMRGSTVWCCFFVLLLFPRIFCFKMTKFGDKKTVTGMYINAIMKKNKKRSRELMKNMGKKIRYIAFFIGVCVLLAGCGKKFDASGYTKAVLDVSYKNEIQKYVELTGADEKEADKIFEDNLQNNMDIMLQEFSGYELPDELEEKYRKLFSDMMKQVKYTVAEAKEVENKNFTVDVKVEPMLIFNDTYQELQKQTEDYATQVSNEVMNGASLPSETDMQTHVFEIYHDILRNYLDQGMKYGDPETITVHVNKDDKNVYTIADEDISKIDGKVMAMDVIEQ